MKKLKVSLSALALILGLGAAFASVPHHALSDKKWGFNQSTGEYEDLTGQQQGQDYRCNESDNVCTALFPEDVDPNDQDNDAHPGTAMPSSVINGTLIN